MGSGHHWRMDGRLIQGGPPPSRLLVRHWTVQRGNALITDYAELANACEDAGFELELRLPSAKGRKEPQPGEGVIQVTVFVADRGFVFAERCDHIGRLESLAIDALATLRAKGLVT